MVNVGDVFNAAGDAAKVVGDSVVAAGKAVNNTINETVGGASDIVSSAFGGDTRAQAQGKLEALEARGQAKQEYERLARQQQGLNVSGTDPAAIRGHDNWDSWSHQDLYTFRGTLKFQQMQESGAAWSDLGKELSEIFADLDKEARAAAGDGMRGEAADAGMNAARPLQEWGRSFGDSVKMNGIKIQEAATTAEETHRSIQEPSEPGTARQIIAGGASVVTFGAAGAADAGLRMKEQEEDAKRARAVAKNVFTPGYDNVDTSTATLPPPRNPLNPPPQPPPPNRPSNDMPSSQDPGVSGRDSGQSVPSTPSTPAMSSSVDSGGVSIPPGGSVPGSSPSVPSPGGPPSGSESAWTKPTPPPPTGGPQPGAQPPGGPPGGGGPMAGIVGTPPGAGGGTGAGAARGLGGAGGAGAARGGAAAPGAGGRSGAGAMGGARPGAPTAGAAGAAGSRGGAMGGAGAGAGRGGEGGEDDEHERPSWLEEPEDVFMNDMPKVAPPVFGA